MSKEWLARKDQFETLDARQGKPGEFFPIVTGKAQSLPKGEGLHVIQSFEPVPLYGVLGDMGFEYETVKAADNEYHVYFYKTPTAPSMRASAAPTVKVKAKPFVSPTKKPSALGAIGLEEGYLTSEQINLVLQHLPVGVVFMDEFDEIRYTNCGQPHLLSPDASCVADFKAGKEDVAEFWQQEAGHFTYIRCFAVRSDEGDYQGVLEISQEVSEIRALTGERRILDWE